MARRLAWDEILCNKSLFSWMSQRRFRVICSIFFGVSLGNVSAIPRVAAAQKLATGQRVQRGLARVQMVAPSSMTAWLWVLGSF